MKLPAGLRLPTEPPPPCPCESCEARRGYEYARTCCPRKLSHGAICACSATITFGPRP